MNDQDQENIFENFSEEDRQTEIFCNKVAASALVPRDLFLEEVRKYPQDLWTNDNIQDITT